MSSTFVQAAPYVPKNKIRVVTAASLFDGHDAAISSMRRIIRQEALGFRSSGLSCSCVNCDRSS